MHNVFYDNWGFPDKLDNYNHLLHNIEGGVILWRKKFPTSPPDVDDPKFNYAYFEELQGEKLWSEV